MALPDDGHGGMMGRYRHWTADEVALLRARYAEGVTYRVIASEIGVTRECISGMIFRLGLTNRRSPVDRLGRIKRRTPLAEVERITTITLAPVPRAKEPV